MKFEKPDLTGLDRAAILAARADAVRLAGEIDNGEDTLPKESLEALEAIAEFLVEADALVEQIDADATEQAERLAKARGGIVAKDEEPAAEEPKEEEPEAAKEEEPVLVASGRKSVTAKAASRQVVTAPEVSTKSVATITAAADVPGIPTGKVLDSLDEVSEAALSRFAAMPRHRVGNQRNRYGLASIQKGRDDEFSMESGEFKTFQEMVMAASKESRLSGGSLVAAGGWCAPSETLYDLCTIESTDGLWDVPEVRAPRGGINFTKGPSFADIYALGGFLVTEAQMEQDPPVEKDCWDVECPEFDEVRMDAIGLCIRAGILTNAAYPELIRRYLEGALIAQQHRVSGNLIQRALTITGAATAIANPWENATALLTALEVAIAGERQRNRLPLSMTLEVVLPFWVKAAIRADLSQRTGVDMLAVTDQQIESYFTVRGARVQWVYNWQDLTIGAGGAGAPATDFPATVEALMYPAGTFVKLSLDVITLDAVYDSTNITTNTYTALFAEEGIALANTCFDAKRISLPLSVSGLTAAAIINQDWNAAPPLYTEV